MIQPPLSTGAIQSSPPSTPGKSFVAHAKIIGLLTLLSRMFGLLRESFSAHFFGAGMVSSAFTFAFTVPNLFRKLLGEGALSSAFIPLYAQSLQHESEEESRSFAASSVKLLTIILIALTVIGELILAAIFWMDPHMLPDRALTLKLTMIMLPYVILVCTTAFLSAILQVHKRFAVPAATPIVLNAIHIAVLIVGGYMLHLRVVNADLENRQRLLAYWLSILVLVAGVLQVSMLNPGLRAVGFRMRLSEPIWTPRIRKMLVLSIPVALSAGVLQLSVLIDKGLSVGLAQAHDRAGNLVTHFVMFGQTIAYPMAAGAVARLNWAQFLYQFPLGVFAIALATAIFPSLSAQALETDRTKFKASLRQGIEATIFEGLAASVGLIIVRYPAIRVLFEHGNFTRFDTDWVARSTMIYATGIWAFSLLTIISRAFYAMHDTTTPLVMSVITLIVNTAVEVPLIWKMGESGMAAGTVASFSLQAVVMLWVLDRRVGGLEMRRILPSILKMILATIGMACACWLIQHAPGWPAGTNRIASIAQLAGLMIVGGVTYLGLCMLMRVEVLQQILKRPK